MQTGNLELIVAWASILGAVLAAFGFLHREMRRGFDRVDQKFDRVDENLDALRVDVTTLKVSVARIEGHLGIGFPATVEQRPGDEPPERAA